MSSFLRLSISAGEISIAVIKKYHDNDIIIIKNITNDDILISR